MNLNVLSHIGDEPLHFSFSKHLLRRDPLSLYPTLHSYVTSLPNVYNVPLMKPLGIGLGLLQLLAKNNTVCKAYMYN